MGDERVSKSELLKKLEMIRSQMDALEQMLDQKSIKKSDSVLSK